jgi:hypothetical protein
MTDKIQIKVDDKTKRVISELHGAAIALGSLLNHDDDRRPKSALPGFALAVALIEKEVAEMRAQMAGAVYRCAAKAGHDVSNLRQIYTTIGKDGNPVIELEAADLVDQAEAAE